MATLSRSISIVLGLVLFSQTSVYGQASVPPKEVTRILHIIKQGDHVALFTYFDDNMETDLVITTPVNLSRERQKYLAKQGDLYRLVFDSNALRKFLRKPDSSKIMCLRDGLFLNQGYPEWRYAEKQQVNIVFRNVAGFHYELLIKCQAVNVCRITSMTVAE